ncbi:hypothetical protein [Mumia zhuanghuii]|uniref:Uncharacterized protein n=1 Tax=Mumia zhuanghuii TaxID=2585211 RepID=A0A5C4MBG3_9ACTN|nr:hypothetical protein [Mumia zhuanghuii]TNC32643.1 hypothetical protein FHE65_30215 [Mumia zhuanghuii]TNC33987.1 hypothetical protein FHE65_28205 [Mumia zhuanghuii]
MAWLDVLRESRALFDEPFEGFDALTAAAGCASWQMTYDAYAYTAAETYEVMRVTCVDPA